MKGLEPPRLTAPDPKSGAAAITPHPQLYYGTIQKTNPALLAGLDSAPRPGLEPGTP